jgi:hypothetical protein
MDRKDNVPLLLSHGLERFVPQNAGVRNEYMDAAELVNGNFHDSFTIFGRTYSGRRLSTSYQAVSSRTDKRSFFIYL